MGRHEPVFRPDLCNVHLVDVSLPVRIRPVVPAEPASAVQARALHARRQLEAAIDHGVALMAALGLPRLVDNGFVPIDRENAGEALSAAVALLDTLDPDPDLEPSLGAPENHTATCVRVADWRWSELPPDQRRWAQGADDGREADVVDEPHDEDTDADLTAPETFGRGFVRCGPDDTEDDDPGETDDNGIADEDGYHEQCGYAVAGALPLSVGGYIG